MIRITIEERLERMKKNVETMRSELLELRNKKGWDNKEWSRATGIEQWFLDSIEAGTLEIEEEDYEAMKQLTKKGETHLFRFKKPVIIACWVHKGGTGKTTVLSNIAYELTERGYDVLAVDADSQADLSSVLFEQYLDAPECNFYDCFVMHDNIKNYTCKTEHEHLDIVPGSGKSEDLEKSLAPLPVDKRRKILSMCLSEVIRDNFYDFILIDMDKSAGLLNKAILEKADYLLAPIEPAIFSSKALIPIGEQIKIVQQTNPNLKLLGVLLNKVDLRKKAAIEDTKQWVDSIFPGSILSSYLSTDGKLETSQRCHLPIQQFKRNGKASLQIGNITNELLERMLKDKNLFK